MPDEKFEKWLEPRKDQLGPSVFPLLRACWTAALASQREASMTDVGKELVSELNAWEEEIPLGVIGTVELCPPAHRSEDRSEVAGGI